MWRPYASWVERQRKDIFVRKAKLEGFRSRAAYKLQDLNESYHLLRPGLRVIDLGAAPGGWSQVAAKLTESSASAPSVLAVDLLPMSPIAGVKILTLDVFQPGLIDTIIAEMQGFADVLLCDMSSNHTGDGNFDCGATIDLTLEALKLGHKVLKPGGNAVFKIFSGLGEPDHFVYTRALFGRLDRVKPEASRSESREMYYVGKNWLHGAKKVVKPRPSAPVPPVQQSEIPEHLKQQTFFASDGSASLERLGRKGGDEQ